MPKFSIGPRTYRTKGEATKAVQAIRDAYNVGEMVDDHDDHGLLRDLIDMHPDAVEKIGCGVDSFVIDRPMVGRHSGFKLVRTDGTEIDFSFLTCLSPPNHRQQVLAAMRGEVTSTISAYFASRAGTNTLTSDLSGTPLDANDPHVSHFQGPPFIEIATQFTTTAGGWDQIELNSASAAGYAKFKDRALAQQWVEHHKAHAKLGLLTAQENLRRPH
ncbi:DCL family protein [Streptomyces sp. NBC_01685]|uniref:DCL family protein n=1 Tax=Streptomyces sp. NBC_01685 TaxID=2975910 RepID=UPI002E2F0380|nr:DCL family protein [Streptomyces sp. NBC_01685]